MSQLVRNIIDGYHDLMDNKSGRFCYVLRMQIKSGKDRQPNFRNSDVYLTSEEPPFTKKKRCRIFSSYAVLCLILDPRVNDWLLMSSPFPTLCICLTYAYVVKILGPKLMENRKPYNLKYVLIVYNLLQVLFSTWLFREAIYGGWFNGYSFRCEPVDYSDNPRATRAAAGCWWYYFSKFTEFLDTLFFVLRKKNSHISTLHVIHHGIMPLSVWFGVKFTPGGHSTFFGFVNSFVHMIMYTYYLLAALGPQMQRYLWWKKYLTTIQMIQFVLVMVHAFQLLFIECDYPKAFVWWIGMHAVMFYFLFSDFYKQAYGKKDKKSVKENGVKSSKKTMNVCFPSQSSLYQTSDNMKSIAKSYTSEDNSSLRNRAFINSSNNAH